MSLYQNKYRIESSRLEGWNYAEAAAYFITICTRHKIHWFGTVKDGKMILSDAGWIVQNEWLKTPKVRPDMHLILDKFVVMPNHFHAIIFIGNNDFNCEIDCATFFNMKQKANKFGPQSKNMASVIRGFKSAVTLAIRKTIPQFAWQDRYHDHIIRTNESFLRIQQYITTNPENWHQDKFFS